MVGGVFFAKACAAPQCFSEKVLQTDIDKWLPRKNQIALVELFAVVLAICIFRVQLAGRRVLIFVDSESVEGALVKGYSAREDVCHLVGLFWAVVEDIDALVYIDRVSTDANISDAPSRGKMAIAKRCGWVVVPGVWPQWPG